MILRRLLRFPGTSFPAAAATGDEVIDGYLRELDALLLGSKSVRLLTLAEIRDHLAEKKALLVSGGKDADEASRQAALDMGPPEGCARPQRARLRKQFLVLFAVLLGPCSLMAALPYFPYFTVTSGWLRQYLAARAAVFSLLPVMLSWLATFACARRRLPVHARRAERTAQSFDVAYPWYMRLPARILTTLMLLVACALFLGGAAGFFFPAITDHLHVPWWLLPVFGTLPLEGAAFGRAACRAYRVDEDGFGIGGVLWRLRRVPWADVTAVGRLTDVHAWIPRWTYWSDVSYVDYVSARGKTRRVHVYPTMLNADRFLLLAEEKLREARASPGAHAGTAEKLREART